MLNNIFLKTLYERRWSVAIWFAVITIMTFLIILLFPNLRDSFGAALTDVPESMQGLLGDIDAYRTIVGYVDLQVIAQMVFLTIIMAVMAGTSLIAGEEKNGTLQTLLAQPVTRVQVYVQKLAALTVITLIACAGLFTGTVLGVFAVGESIAYDRLFLATLMTWVLTFFFAAMAYGLGAMTGKRSIGGVFTGFYAFIAYMLTALAGLSSALEKLNYGSPFYYFNSPSVLKFGLDFGNIAVLSGATLFFIVLGLIIFKRRDINA